MRHPVSSATLFVCVRNKTSTWICRRSRGRSSSANPHSHHWWYCTWHVTSVAFVRNRTKCFGAKFCPEGRPKGLRNFPSSAQLHARTHALRPNCAHAVARVAIRHPFARGWLGDFIAGRVCGTSGTREVGLINIRSLDKNSSPHCNGPRIRKGFLADRDVADGFEIGRFAGRTVP